MDVRLISSKFLPLYAKSVCKIFLDLKKEKKKTKKTIEIKSKNFEFKNVVYYLNKERLVMYKFYNVK